MSSTHRAEPAGVKALGLDRVRLLDGPLRTIQELHRTGLLGGLEPDRLLFPFRRCAGLTQPDGVTAGYGGWDDGFISGHYAGHYLSAASRMAAATGDPALADRVRYLVAVLADCQARLGGGYLAAFPATRFDRLEATPHAASVDYYTVHKVLAGLVDAARYVQCDQALDMAAAMADYFAARMARLTAEQIEVLCRTDYSPHPTNEYGGMAEALAELTLLSRERGRPDADRHLALARLFCRDWLIEPLLAGEDRLDGLHGNTHTAHLAGAARVALADGDERLWRAARQFWRLLVERHTFANGGSAYFEKLRGGGVEVAGTGPAMLGPLTAEYCNTNNQLKLTETLFRLAPSSGLADYWEGALYNHIVAAIAPDTGLLMYHMSMRPGDYRMHIDEPYCCQGTGLENSARFGEGIAFHRGAELWLNLYVAAELDWRELGLRLRLSTAYPADGLVTVGVRADMPRIATLRLRSPGWLTEPAALAVNGEPLSVTPGADGYQAVERVWHDGDTLTLRLPVGLRRRVSRDDPRTVSYYHGPLLLAGALGREGMPAVDVGSNMALADAPLYPVPVFIADQPDLADAAIRPIDGVPCGYTARLTRWTDQQPETVTLAPLYQVQHQRYAVYWQVLPQAELAAHAARQSALAGSGSAVGDEEAERHRQLQGERTRTGCHAGRRWRDAVDGGWFSYRLPLPGPGAAALVCTYWGSETGHRTFDLRVDDHLIATQTLAENQPGSFFAVTYPLPASLTHGKQFVVVRFQAHPGAIAGGVYDVRLNVAP